MSLADNQRQKAKSNQKSISNSISLIFDRPQKKLMKTCYFREEMDGGYFLFSSMMNPTMYLGFNRRGKPINSTSPNTDKQCRKIFKRITEESSNGLSASTIDYEQTTSASSSSNYVTHRVRHHHGSPSSQATKTHPRTHSNRIATSEAISTSPQTSSKRNKLQSNHHHRHRHNEHHHHTTSNNIDKDIDNLSSTKQLGYEDLNAIYNQSDSGVNTLSEIRPTAHFRHTKKRPKKVDADSNPDDQPQQQQLGVHRRKDPNSAADSVHLDSNTDNCTYGTDESDDKRGRRIGKSRSADDKPNNKCNNNNRKHRKHNENGRLRKPSQKAASHKNQTSEPLNLN